MMTATKLKLSLGALLAAVVATMLMLQAQKQAKLQLENESLREQVTQLKRDNEPASRPVVPVEDSPSRPNEQFSELLRLRGELGVLRHQTNELAGQLASARRVQPREFNPLPQQEPAAPLPADYPKTPDGATKSIFEAWSRGDWNAFVTNFGEPGVPREVYEQAFGDPAKSNYLAGMEIVSIGEPTNSFGPNMWFVPYKLRFTDGSEKEFRLHVAQDAKTQRWYFKGGF